ncbi:MAG: DUF1320 family protein [Paludibacter sp.]|nr:DUF1320 family protein [Paludibacter sp.]
MAFLTKDELNTVVDLNLIDAITDVNDDIVNDIIDESIDKMKGFLSRYYDIDTIFNAEGTARKKSIVKRLKDIVIYEIYERHTLETNAVAARRYAEAIDWLEKSYTGELGDRTLPNKVVEEAETEGAAGDFRFGGDVQFDSNY